MKVPPDTPNTLLNTSPIRTVKEEEKVQSAGSPSALMAATNTHTNEIATKVLQEEDPPTNNPPNLRGIAATKLQVSLNELLDKIQYAFGRFLLAVSTFGVSGMDEALEKAVKVKRERTGNTNDILDTKEKLKVLENQKTYIKDVLGDISISQKDFINDEAKTLYLRLIKTTMVPIALPFLLGRNTSISFLSKSENQELLKFCNEITANTELPEPPDFINKRIHQHGISQAKNDKDLESQILDRIKSLRTQILMHTLKTIKAETNDATKLVRLQTFNAQLNNELEKCEDADKKELIILKNECREEARQLLEQLGHQAATSYERDKKAETAAREMLCGIGIYTTPQKILQEGFPDICLIKSLSVDIDRFPYKDDGVKILEPPTFAVKNSDQIIKTDWKYYAASKIVERYGEDKLNVIGRLANQALAAGFFKAVQAPIFSTDAAMLEILGDDPIFQKIPTKVINIVEDKVKNQITIDVEFFYTFVPINDLLTGMYGRLNSSVTLKLSDVETAAEEISKNDKGKEPTETQEALIQNIKIEKTEVKFGGIFASAEKLIEHENINKLQTIFSKENTAKIQRLIKEFNETKKTLEKSIDELTKEIEVLKEQKKDDQEIQKKKELEANISSRVDMVTNITRFLETWGTVRSPDGLSINDLAKTNMLGICHALKKYNTNFPDDPYELGGLTKNLDENYKAYNTIGEEIVKAELAIAEPKVQMAFHAIENLLDGRYIPLPFRANFLLACKEKPEIANQLLLNFDKLYQFKEKAIEYNKTDKYFVPDDFYGKFNIFHMLSDIYSNVLVEDGEHLIVANAFCTYIAGALGQCVNTQFYVDPIKCALHQSIDSRYEVDKSVGARHLDAIENAEFDSSIYYGDERKLMEEGYIFWPDYSLFYKANWSSEEPQFKLKYNMDSATKRADGTFLKNHKELVLDYQNSFDPQTWTPEVLEALIICLHKIASDSEKRVIYQSDISNETNSKFTEGLKGLPKGLRSVIIKDEMFWSKLDDGKQVEFSEGLINNYKKLIEPIWNFAEQINLEATRVIAFPTLSTQETPLADKSTPH